MKISNCKLQIAKRPIFKSFALCILHFALCIFFLGPAFAGLNDLDVTSSISSSEIRIGERIQFKVLIEHDKGLDIYYPDESSLSLPPFELVKQKTTLRKGALGRDVTEVLYLITTFDAGEFVVSPILITAKDGYGNERNVKTLGHAVSVKTGVAVGSEIIDILPPMEVTERFAYMKQAARYLPFVALFLMISLIALYFLRAKNQKALLQPDPRSTAINRLEMLGVDEDCIEKAYFEISEILRVFFHQHLQIESLKMTSRELMLDLKGRSGIERLNDEAEDLFFDLDLVKFSPFKPSLEDARNAIIRAESLIKEVP